jgi:hypothetical protein
VRVSNIFVGIYDTLRIVKISLHPYEPHETVFTIGKPPKTIREFFRQMQKAEQIVSKITDSTGKITVPALPSSIPSGGTTILRAKLVRELSDGFQITFEDDTIHNYTVTTIDANTFRLTDESGFYTDFVSL